MLDRVMSGFEFPRLNLRSNRRCKSVKFRPECVAVESLEVRQLLSQDPVLDWNSLLLDAVRIEKTAPPIAARAMAIVHTAIFDAVNSISRECEPYLSRVQVHPAASKEAAVAGAAHETLIALFPSQQATFDQALARSLADIPDGAAETQGLNVGQRVAELLLQHRGNDGASNIVNYTAGTEPGDWQPTLPAFARPLLPQWPDVTPFVIQDTTTYLPAAPPKLESRRYAADLNEVKQIGASNSTLRTADQTNIARFWANGAGTATPPGHWNIIAAAVSEQKQLTLEENARLFAILNVALADSAIVCWAAKYEYDMWRPVTAIRAADTDNNPRTVADANWTPLLVTPAFPTYTSGHSTFSGAAAAVLKSYFGTDRVSFVAPSETPGIASRSFRSFSAAADESGMSRIYGGIHFGFDNTAGLNSGRRIGEFASRQFAKTDRGVTSAWVADGQLIVTGSGSGDVIRIEQRASIFHVLTSGRRIGSFSSTLFTSILVDAGAGNDIVNASGLLIACIIHGGQGNDWIAGGEADDQLFGDDGNDSLFGNGGNDLLVGGAGRDVLHGGRGRDILTGTRGLDRLFGGTDEDQLTWI